jgi:uncharacterized RDD family membrane protein YckC
MSEDKAKRETLANRRAVAILIELCAVKLLIVIIALTTGNGDSISAGWRPLGLYLLLRGLIGTANMSKRFVGLRLISVNGGAISTWAGIKRNLLLIIHPAVLLPVGYASLIHTDQQTRFGDMWAKTRVVDMAPDTKGQGSWRIYLILALGVFSGLFFV